MLVWYTNKLYENHANTPLTPARVEMVRIDLYNLQMLKRKTETNPIWEVPVDINVDYSLSQFEVFITDKSNILYLDFDQ